MNVENSEKESSGELQSILIGGELDAASVTLRFFGDELEPTEITELLRFEPTDSCRKGESTGKRIQRIAKTGKWLLDDHKKTDQNLETQITELLSRLPQDLEVWRELSNRFDANIYCGAWLKTWNRDIWFSPNLLKRISERGLDIGIAIYCEGDDEDEL